MERVNEEIVCFSTMLRTIAHSVRTQFGALVESAPPSHDAVDDGKTKPSAAGETAKPSKQSDDASAAGAEQKPLALDETIELLDLAGQLLESDNNAFRIRALLLETRPNIVEVLVAILVSNPTTILPLSAGIGAGIGGGGAASGSRSNSSLAGASTLRHDHEQVQRRFASLQWKAMSSLARACALAAPTDATASQFGFVLDSFEVPGIALRYLVMEDAGLSLRTCAAEVLFLCLTKLSLAERAAMSHDTVDTIVFQLAESEAAAQEDTLRCYLVGALHALGPVERLLSADFVDVTIGILRSGPVYACTKMLELLAQLFKRNPHFVPTSLPGDRVLLLAETFGSVLTRLADHPEVIIAVCKVISICAITSALAVEDDVIVQSAAAASGSGNINNSMRGGGGGGDLFGGGAIGPGLGTPSSRRGRSVGFGGFGGGGGGGGGGARAAEASPEDGPGRFLVLFTHQHGPWRHLLIAGKTDATLVEARAAQMRAMRTVLQCLIHPAAMQRLADELGRDLPLFSALLSAPLRLPPFHDAAGEQYVSEASLCLTFLMAKVPAFRADVRRAVASFPAWLQNLEARLVEGMEAGLQSVTAEIGAIQLVDVCGNLLNSVGFVDRFAPRAWSDVQALEVCVARLFEFQQRVDPHEPRPALANPSAADDDGAPFVSVFVDGERKAMVLTTGVLAYAICLSFQEVDPAADPYMMTSSRQQQYRSGVDATSSATYTTDPSNFVGSRSGSRAPGDSSRTPSAHPNYVATEDIEEVDTTDTSTEAESTYQHLQHQQQQHFSIGSNVRPSPYSLHAMKSRADHHTGGHQQFALPQQQQSQQHRGAAGGKPGFVQRNAVGMYEPVRQAESLPTNANTHKVPQGHPHFQQQLQQQQQQQHASVALPSHQHISRTRSGSGGAGRKSTPTRSGGTPSGLTPSALSQKRGGWH